MLSISVNNTSRTARGFAVLCLLYCHVSMAQLQLSQDITMSGFGTISASKSDNETPVLTHRDITDEWCFDCDTTLGFQLDWLVSSVLRTTLQVAKRPQDHFSDPELERAFIEYAVENTRIKVGRLRTPIFMMSEYYYVSNAYPWLRLPASVYGSSLGITHYDGVTVDFSYLLGEESLLSLSPFITLPREETYERHGQSFKLEVSHAVGIRSEFYYDENLLHFSYVNASAEQRFLTLPKVKHDVNITSLGISHYFDHFHFQSEATFAQDLTANWYAGLDYHLGAMTPYIQYMQSRRGIENNSYLLGFRYNWTDRVSSSVEWQRIEGEEKVISGHFTQPQDPRQSLASKVDLFSISLSFTF